MQNISDCRTRTAEIIVEKDIIEFNMRHGFKRSSGVVSPFYIDNRKLISYPELHREVLDSMIALIQQHIPLEKIDVIAGSAVGGVPHAALIAYKLKKPLVFTRLENGMSKPTDARKRVVEGVLKHGSNLILIEDHVTTGLTVLDSVEALKEQGGNVALCISITDDGLEEASRRLREQDVPLFSLTSLNEVVRHATEMNKINAVHTKAIEAWQNNPWSFREWIQAHGHTPLSVSVERPVIISNLTFNTSSTFGYDI